MLQQQSRVTSRNAERLLTRPAPCYSKCSLIRHTSWHCHHPGICPAGHHHIPLSARTVPGASSPFVRGMAPPPSPNRPHQGTEEELGQLRGSIMGRRVSAEVLDASLCESLKNDCQPENLNPSQKVQTPFKDVPLSLGLSLQSQFEGVNFYQHGSPLPAVTPPSPKHFCPQGWRQGRK